MKPLVVRIAEERFYSIKNKQIVHFWDNEDENIFLNADESRNSIKNTNNKRAYTKSCINKFLRNKI